MAADFSGYETKRRNVESGYAANVAANDYGRHVSQIRGSRQVGDQARGFQRAWPKQVSGWGGRGHTGPNVQSGFYRKAMQNYVGDYQRTRNDTMQDLANEQTQFGLTDARMDAERQQALADIEFQKQSEIAQLAQNIAAVQPNL